MAETPWRSKRFAYDSAGNLEYVGKHKSPQAAVADAGWYIQKMVYDSSSNLTDTLGPELGSWGGRAGLF